MFQLRKMRITSVRRHWMSPKLTRKNYTFDASLRKAGSQKMNEISKPFVGSTGH